MTSPRPVIASFPRRGIRAAAPRRVARAAAEGPDADADDDRTLNRALAYQLDEIARLLSDQSAGAFRVRAYRNAAETLRGFDQPVSMTLEREGIDGLIAIPTIGVSIANLISQQLHTGHMPLLDRLRGDEIATRTLSKVPGVGEKLAHRIHEALDIETLPELMAAAGDGRLKQVPGVGRKRIETIAQFLRQTLRRRRHDLGTAPLPAARTDIKGDAADDRGPQSESVPVSELLDLDQEYRRRDAAGELSRIAPKKHNPEGKAWLPVWHTERGERHYTVLYSNTERAHRLNTTRDWVVIFRDDPESHDRWTVITARFGKLKGCRIVRGREAECEAIYLRPGKSETP